MEFYFDIEFIEEMQKMSGQTDILIDFIRFVKQLNGTEIYVFLNLTAGSSEILINNPLLKFITDSRPFTTLPHSDINQILNNEESTGFKMFFLNSIDTSIIRKDFGYFALNVNEIFDNSELFNSGRQDLKKITSDKIGDNYLNSWRILNNFKHPINSIVINDRYFLNKTDTIDLNFLSILDNIGLTPLKNRKVDVCIITEEILNIARRDDPVTVMNSKFEKVYNIIKKHLDKILGRNNYNITILRADKNTKPSASKLHYRILFTNFLIINAEPSFSFFERTPDGKIYARVNEDVSFDFVLWQRSRVSLQLKLENMKLAFHNNVDQNSNTLKRRVLSNNKHCRLFLD